MQECIKLNLGCGTDIREGYINIDIRSLAGIDVVADLTTVHNMFTDVDEILAYDIIEHFSHTEKERILADWFGMLKSGGKMIIKCPNPKSICWHYVLGKFSCLGFNRMIYGGQDYAYNYHKSALDKGSVIKLFRKLVSVKNMISL